ELEKAGIEQYEISNFAKDGAYSKHNTSYWQSTPYLGLGPSAHSFDGTNREWTVASIKQYIESIDANTVNREVEELDTRTRYNDYILTGLRTKWGIELDYITSHFGADYLSYCLEQAEPFLKEGLLVRDNNTIKLSRDGIFISDGIMSDLMKLNDTEC
ncbi:MAG: coproporphyrinogen III oxidase, partial [Tannerellaceae bacterium]